MEVQKPPSRMVVLTGFVLAMLLVIAFAAVLLTQTLSQKVSQETPTPPATPSPTESLLYLDLPQGFPRDLLLPPNAKVTVGAESDNDWTATFLTTMQLEEVSSYYIKELPKAGWLITNQTQGGGLTVIYVTKEKREAIIAIGKGDLGITVSMTILKNL